MKYQIQKIIFNYIVVLILAGCSAVSVKTVDQVNGGRLVEVQKQLCDIPSKLALFVDKDKNLWLNCPYRYQGQTHDKFENISPNQGQNQAISFSSMKNEIRLMKQISINKCGDKKYCAALDEYGYLDFSMQHKTDCVPLGCGIQGAIRESVVVVTYLDMSKFLVDVETFYATLDGKKREPNLKPNLVKLVSPSRVSERIARLTSLEDIENVLNQLKILGLYDNKVIKVAIDNKLNSPEISAKIRQRALTNGTFDDVMEFAKKGDREALKRAYDLAKSQSEKQRLELVLINTLKNNLFSFSTKLEGTQNVKPSDVNAFIARLIETKITSRVQYEATLDQKIFQPNYDYILNAKINLTATGKESGERNCGLLWLGICKFENQDASKTYSQPIQINVSKSENYKKSGVANLDWKSVSGGSGFASGFIMGGTKIFKATGLSVSISIDSIEMIR